MPAPLSFPQPNTPWVRFTAAAAIGALWGLSFPTPGIAGFAWAVPGLLLAAASGTSRRLSFRLGYTAGATHYLLSLSWLRHIPFPAGAYAGWFALSLFLALVPAAWIWLTWSAAERMGIAPHPPDDSRTLGMGGFRGLGDRFAAAAWTRLNLWFLASASAWVAGEMILARLFGGFPWNLLGASQYRMLPLVQMASFTGVYGISFVIVWFSTSLLAATVLLLRFPDRPAAWRRPLLFPAFMMVALFGGGFLTLLTDTQPPKRLTVALIQPSIPQTILFDPAANTNRFDALLQLTQQALATKPDLVVWPEASLPGGISEQDYQRLVQAVHNAGAWLIFGADDTDAGEGTDPHPKSYNAAFLLGPDGNIAARYRKRRLVMFGEYIPFGRWFPFLQRLAPIGDGFHPGPGPTRFPLGPDGPVVSPVICFEDNFPQQIREHAPDGIDILVNLTNDAWFARSSAQWQHFANAVFRAVENGIPLVRATNNGISCWIDPRGRVHSTRLATGRDVYEAGFETLTLVYGAELRTVYRRFGDVFGWLCTAAALIPLLPSRRTPGAPAPRATASLPSDLQPG